MSTLAMDIARLVDMLPESDQHFAHEFVKMLVLICAPAFTKVIQDGASNQNSRRKLVHSLGEYWLG